MFGCVDNYICINKLFDKYNILYTWRVETSTYKERVTYLREDTPFFVRVYLLLLGVLFFYWLNIGLLVFIFYRSIWVLSYKGLLRF